MNYKKLTLASAIAMAPTMAFSEMVEMVDASLSEVSGQDGIEIVVGAPAAGIGGNIYLHDKDGLTGTPSPTFSFDGAIVIENFRVFGNFNIDIDAGASANTAGQPTLNIEVTFPAAVTIHTGAIRVANSQRDNAGWLIDTPSNTLLNNMTIVMSGLALNIQLGNEPQGNMIAVSSTITNGLVINSFALNDAGGALSGGAIGSSTMTLVDNGGANLSLKINANATTNGLVIDLAQVGSSTTGMDIRINDQYLGTTTAGIVGDITILGLNLNGTTLTVSGK